MNTKIFMPVRFLANVCLFSQALVGQIEPPLSKALPNLTNLSPIAAEAAIVKAARAAMRNDDDSQVDVLITLPAAARLRLVSSVALARRAAAVCGWLHNDNDLPRARKLARKAIAALAPLKETTPADHVERLYWEAWLEAQILDRRDRAVRLLEEARTLAPEDERISSLELGLLNSVGIPAR
jgi:hypothetical protein